MAATAAALASMLVALAAAASEVAANKTTLLLVDDHEVLYHSGLTRVLEPLRRVHPGQPAVAADKPWETLLGYTSVQQIGSPGHLTMWYQSYSAGGVAINGSDCFVAMATSTDVRRARVISPSRDSPLPP